MLIDGDPQVHFFATHGEKSNKVSLIPTSPSDYMHINTLDRNEPRETKRGAEATRETRARPPEEMLAA
jgi:hypothetical protein